MRKIMAVAVVSAVAALSGCATAPEFLPVQMPFAHASKGVAVSGSIGYVKPNLVAAVAVEAQAPTAYSNDWLAVTGSAEEGVVKVSVDVKVPLVKE